MGSSSLPERFGVCMRDGHSHQEDFMSQESLENFDSQLAPAQQAPAEKLIPQSKVEELIVNAKHEAAEKTRRQLMQQQQQPSYQEAPQQNQQAQQGSYGGGQPDVRSIVEEEFGRHFNELSKKAQEEQLKTQIDQAKHEIASKIVNSPVYAENKDLFDDLPAIEQLPFVYDIAHSFDNSAEIMLEFAKNPLKMVNFETLARMNPAKANAEMHKLAESIKINAASKAMALPGEPMSQLKSSPNSTGGGPKTVEDYQKVYRG